VQFLSTKLFAFSPLSLHINTASQAKKEYNYARFFSILRSPSTPYLYACIMFKHVDQMRKIAFRIMAKTFGARRKDTGENFYDQYPLRDLVHLLCFEDADEAREACCHYNITVREVPSAGSGSGSGSDPSTAPSDSSTEEIIFWRHADFKEPIDPAKGTVKILRPRKMIRTIEAKLNGASRLAVCRGQASGEGAALSRPVAVRQGSTSALSPSLLRGKARDPEELRQEEQERKKRAEEEARAAAERAAEEAKRREAERKRLEDLARRKAEEAERKRREEAERKRLEEIARRKAEEEKKQRLEADRIRRVEIARLKAEAEERRRREEAVKAEAERKRREEEERLRIAREKEEARRRAEEEERERQRQLVLKRAEEERQRKIRQAEEEKRRREEEARRLLELKLQREREEEERRRKVEEERKRRIEQEWERKMNAARKLMVWRIWQSRLRQRRYSIDSTQQSLGRIDPTFFNQSSPLMMASQRSAGTSSQDALVISNNATVIDESEPSPVEVFFRLGTDDSESINLCDMCRMILNGNGGESGGRYQHSVQPLASRNEASRSMILFKLAVVVIGTDFDKDMSNVLGMWLDSRLSFGKVMSSQFNEHGRNIDVRTVAVDGSLDPEACKCCDAVLFVVAPSQFELQHEMAEPGGLTGALQHIDPDTPRVVINFSADSSNGQQILSQVFNDFKSGQAGKSVNLEPSSDDLDAIDGALRSSCVTLLLPHAQKALPNKSNGRSMPSVEKVAFRELGTKCLCNSLWRFQLDGRVQSISQSTGNLLRLCRITLKMLQSELKKVGTQVRSSNLCSWPPADFVKQDEEGCSVLPNYFHDGKGVPGDWQYSLCDLIIKDDFSKYFGAFFTAKSIRSLVQEMTKGAPQDTREKCDVLLWNKQYNLCLETALTWRENGNTKTFGEGTLYVPSGSTDDIVEHVLAAVIESETYKEYPAICDFEETSPRRPAVPVEMHERAHIDKSRLNGGISGEELNHTPKQHENPGIKRIIEQENNAGMRPKRRRPNRLVKKMSTEQEQSEAFTSQLEALLHGEVTIDLPVGGGTLAEILGDCRDDINVPDLT